MKTKVISCAFCRGKGIDQFGILSPVSRCQVCGGTGKVEVEEPAIVCAFCNGTGVYPHNGRVTCTVCNGKGMVTIADNVMKCPKCGGTGREFDSGLPCLECGGKGVVEKEEAH